MVSNPQTSAPDWREAKRRSAREAILEAAWDLVRDEGLAGLSIRDLAKRAGITTPTVYAYFESKHAIYDAMFGQAAEEFADLMWSPYGTDDPEQELRIGVRRFLDFCTSNVPRYQLLFQRTIPGFEPSPESFAHSLRSYEHLLGRLRGVGVSDQRLVDMWTAMSTGLVDQQISNDLGGDRWSRLIDDFVDMFLAYARTQDTSAEGKKKPSKGKGRQT
jgi:AcrR family transcriptional regulator